MRGELDARATAAETARLLGIAAEEVVVLSTGVIGLPMRLDRIRAGLPPAAAALSAEGGEDAADGDHDHRHARQAGGRRRATASPSAAWRRARG